MLESNVSSEDAKKFYVNFFDKFNKKKLKCLMFQMSFWCAKIIN